MAETQPFGSLHLHQRINALQWSPHSFLFSKMLYQTFNTARLRVSDVFATATVSSTHNDTGNTRVASNFEHLLKTNVRNSLCTCFSCKSHEHGKKRTLCVFFQITQECCTSSHHRHWRTEWKTHINMNRLRKRVLASESGILVLVNCALWRTIQSEHVS